jgi:hypothetical protein
MTKIVEVIFKLEDLNLIPGSEDTVYFWRNWNNRMIDILQFKGDYNIGLLSPKHRLKIIINAMLSKVFDYLRDVNNYFKPMMTRLADCRAFMIYDGEKQVGMVDYHNRDSVTPKLPIISLEGKAMGTTPNISPYNNQEDRHGNNKQQNNFKEDRDRERFLRDQDNKNTRRPANNINNNRNRERSRSRDKRYNNNDRIQQKEVLYDYHPQDRYPDRNKRGDNDNRKKPELCMDQLSYDLGIKGRNPCFNGRDKCSRDHNFKMPISRKVKEEALELLKSAKYGTSANDTRKKFKVDMLKAIG